MDLGPLLDSPDQLRVRFPTHPTYNFPHKLHPSLGKLELVDPETDRKG